MKVIRLLLTLAATTPLLAQQPPDPWERLRGDDANKDGRISRQEFRGPALMFDRMDANGDGFVVAAEARVMRRSLPGQRPGDAARAGMPGLPQRVDQNGDGQISRAEWDRFFEETDKNGDEIVEPEEWRAATRGESLPDPAPPVGTPIPKVKATSLKMGHEVDLSKPARTTVLVFGSHT